MQYKKASILMSPQVFMQQKLQKHSKRNCENGPKQCIFRASLVTNGIKKYLNLINNYFVTIQIRFSAKRLHFNVYFINYGNKNCKKQSKTVKMAQNSQFLHLHQVLMEWKNILIASSKLYYNIGNMQCKKAPFLMLPQVTMQQKL